MPTLLPTPPSGTYDDPAEERLYRKQRLAAAFRLFSLFGFDEGVAGHITARDPEDTETFWVNPFAMHFGHIRVSDLILVNSRGEVVEGDRPVNRAAFAIHSQVHAARPDVVAAAHSHSVHGKAWSALGRLLDPITQDVCAFYEDHALFDDYTGVVLDLEEGKRIAHALGGQQGGHPAQPRAAHGRPRASRRRRGGSSPWSARARPSCWPSAAGTARPHRPRAGRADPLPGRHARRRVVQLPAAARSDRAEQPDLLD